ncbi:c-type cytochrome [Brumimicrobium oceani]|uniref:Cytochrome c domain-containing protein n=1 Tax=Brumimicrobium oceani TaxID=2100725 RepID=A0A2U2XGZ5_9FLAO|nr:c-type cytochrome [Brumimicrobium oceani]PWH87064.1 hypothetical protein DIT68_02040 [Brumimicrobium oceani]
MKLLQLMAALATFTLLSCGNHTNDTVQAIEANSNPQITTSTVSDDIALISLRNNCYACHNPKTESHDDILAPPLAGIKRRYKKQYPDEQSFVEHMTEFIDSPSEEEALMKGPIKRFGLMPKTALSKDEIKELAKYIYHHPIEAPKWFQSYFKEKHGKE